jgi:glycosyltransferase involved in cell wall biosynthesis
VKLAIWSPQPWSPEGLHLGARGMDVVWVSEDEAPRGIPQARPSDPPPVDLDLYDVADRPAHAFAFRAARERPGVVLLRDASLPLLLADEMSRPESRKETLREMERAYGEDGAFVARLVARGLGGDVLPAFFPFVDRLLEASLGVVALTEEIRSLAARRLGDDRVVRLPLHLVATHLLPHLLASPESSSPGEARRSLGIPADSPVIGAASPDFSRLPMLSRVASRLRAEFPTLRLLVGGFETPVPDATCVPDLRTMAAAADVVVALDPITPGGIPAGLAEAIAARRPLVVNAGSESFADFAEGSIARIDPGRSEEAELEEVLRLLLRRPDLREALGRLAAEEARRVAEPSTLAEALVSFLTGLLSRKEDILRALREARVREAAFLHLLSEEVESVRRSLGLPDVDLGLPALFERLVRASR